MGNEYSVFTVKQKLYNSALQILKAGRTYILHVILKFNNISVPLK
jgi:hypothetical protein